MPTLDEPSVTTTDDILDILTSDEARIKDEEEKLSNAIEELHTFFLIETPEWQKDKEPKKSEDGKVIKEGIPQQTLYQYEPKNQKTFNEHARIISKAMASMPRVVMTIQTELWHYEREPSIPPQIPIMTPPPQFAPPPSVQPEKKEGIFQRLFKRSPSPALANKDSPYYQMQEQIRYIKEIPEKWRVILEYHVLAVAGEGASWSSESERIGMEDFKRMIYTAFSYWIEPSLLMIVKYGNELLKAQTKRDAVAILVAMNELAEKHAKQPFRQPTP